MSVKVFPPKKLLGRSSAFQRWRRVIMRNKQNTRDKLCRKKHYHSNRSYYGHPFQQNRFRRTPPPQTTYDQVLRPDPPSCWLNPLEAGSNLKELPPRGVPSLFLSFTPFRPITQSHEGRSKQLPHASRGERGAKTDMPERRD